MALSPNDLRDLAAIFLSQEQQPHKPYLHAVFEREAARREAEAKPEPCKHDWDCRNARPCICLRCGAKASSPVEREGPGSAADDLPSRLRATTERMANHARVSQTLWNDHSNAVLKAADKIEAQARREQELAKSLNSVGLERDALKARVFKYDTGGGYMRSMGADFVEVEFAQLQDRVARLTEALRGMLNAFNDPGWVGTAAKACDDAAAALAEAPDAQG
jgi:hypothetical protein